MEEEEVKEEEAHPHDQPTDVKAAPKLLQTALEKGEVDPDDSEKEEGPKKEEEKKREEESKASPSTTDHHHHARVSGLLRGSCQILEEYSHPHDFVSFFRSQFPNQAEQLDFLLSKASEYSNFISKDLEELQNAMTEDARRKIERAEKRSKKRKGDGKETSKKKSKKNTAEALKSALTKDAQGRAAGSRPIFVQAPNLADGCFLMDYQLEGVRWLASLFENGVSGILADEVSGTLALWVGQDSQFA
jgi:SNF2 family DNA or RNA helicase